MPPTERSFPAQFDPTAWEQDLARDSAGARKAATAARERYEAARVPLAELRPCEAQGRDGTELPACFKTYLPSPAERFGIVFRVKAFDDGARLVYLAFGEALRSSLAPSADARFSPDAHDVRPLIPWAPTGSSRALAPPNRERPIVGRSLQDSCS